MDSTWNYGIKAKLVLVIFNDFFILFQCCFLDVKFQGTVDSSRPIKTIGAAEVLVYLFLRTGKPAASLLSGSLSLLLCNSAQRGFVFSLRCNVAPPGQHCLPRLCACTATLMSRAPELQFPSTSLGQYFEEGKRKPD